MVNALLVSTRSVCPRPFDSHWPTWPTTTWTSHRRARESSITKVGARIGHHTGARENWTSRIRRTPTEAYRSATNVPKDATATRRRTDAGTRDGRYFDFPKRRTIIAHGQYFRDKIQIVSYRYTFEWKSLDCRIDCWNPRCGYYDCYVWYCVCSPMA